MPIIVTQQLIEKTESVLETFANNYGFNHDGVYCQTTGRQIAQADECDIDSLIDMLPGDSEEIADDLAMRICASMRPSILWNKMRSESIQQLAKHRPEEVIAYMVNRIFHPAQASDLTQHMTAMQNRIKFFDWLEDQPVDSEKMKDVLHILLRVDAVIPPSEKFKPGKADTSSLESFHKQVMGICETIISAHHAKSSNAFRRGNPLASSAYRNSFAERAATTPAQVKKQEKRKDQAYLDNLFTSLQGESIAPPPPEPKPVPVASTKMPARFGVKK